MAKSANSCYVFLGPVGAKLRKREIEILPATRKLAAILSAGVVGYKGKTIDVKEVGREPGVRCVPEGSVRKSTNRVRITGQLIDANTGGHLWPGRFEENLEDVFALQDQITGTVVGQIAEVGPCRN